MDKEQFIEHESGGGCLIPKSYRVYSDTGAKMTPEYYDDVYAMKAFPKAEWDEEHHKYRLTFHCADFGGYDVCSMEFYFDTWGELRRWVLNQLERDDT